MTILAVLYILCIFGVCICGDPKDSANVESPKSFEADVESPEDTFSDGTESEDPQDPSPGGENVTASEGTDVQNGGLEDALKSEEPVVPSSPGTLNIASPDTSKISSMNRDSSEAKCKIYIPKSGSSITSVVDGGRELWKATGDEKCKAVSLFSRNSARFLTVYLEGEGEQKYFGEEAGAWKEIDMPTFYKGINGKEYVSTKDENEIPILSSKPMGKEVPNPFYNPSDPGILDLKTPDTTAFQCINCHVDSVPTRLYIPNECHSIKNVVVDSNELWKGTFCPLVLLHHLDNKPVFVRIITEDPTGISDVLYEVKNDGKWEEIPSDTQMKSLKETANTTIGIILDINYPPSSINEVKTNWCGLDVQLFVPDNQYYASEVCLSSESIWKPGDDEKCVLIIAHLEHAFPIAVHLLVRDKNSAVTSLFFIRDGAFKTSTGREYYDKISVTRRETWKSKPWTCCV